MLPLLWPHLDRPMKVLCLGAHSDDIEIGCGGTILRLVEDIPDLEVTWVVLSAEGARRREALASAKRFLKGVRRPRILVKEYRESYFPYLGAAVKAYFERVKRTCDPDVIFTHYRQDLHQDHRAVSDLTWNTFRKHLIFEYEIPKYDGDLGAPSVFMPLDHRICARKVRLLMHGFATQRDRHWFTEDTFWGLLRLRGVESGASHFAEALHVRKVNLAYSTASGVGLPRPR